MAAQICPVCGSSTQDAVCEVDGTTLDVLAEVAAAERETAPEEAPAPAKKSRRKS